MKDRPILFDTSYLPPADVVFAVIADTHYMIDPGDQPLEFESRRHQTHRSRAALSILKQLNTDFTIHLGDLVQEYPETRDYPQGLSEALAQIEEIGLNLHHCAGNHDVGDKPDPSMPTHPVTTGGLDAYHDRVGKSWYSFDHSDHHIVVINSQILNTDLKVAKEQAAWLEADLASTVGKRIALFLHLPPYLRNPADQAFGNYDVISEPDRSWLLELVDSYNIELMCAAHVHFAFFDRLSGTDYYILPSPAFSRPGFSHLFTSAPPPEHGRDDTPKLGFYLFRSGSSFLDAHIIRTSGQTESLPGSRIITRTARALPDARLGVTLTHTPAPIGQVPIAYPSIVRQTVRNDYPLLTCQEMGLRHLRVPIDDILNPIQNNRIQIIRARGAEITAVCATRGIADLEPRMRSAADSIDTVELQIAKDDLPLFTRPLETNLQTSLCIVDPSERVTGKQHLRTRVGAASSEIHHLDHPFDRTMVSIAYWEDPTKELTRLISQTPAKPVDISLDLLADDVENEARVASGAMLCACLPETRLFCQPFQDLDRTMDISKGFLDGLCNPRSIVTIYQILNTLLSSKPERWDLAKTNPLTIRSSSRELSLETEYQEPGRWIDLISGTSHEAGQDIAIRLGIREVSR
ncbi:MAG: metallophosphoesterase [Candidatus Latescibacterota bacterium]|nr:metallophosphoesterase [Candidatus Latescibacterota bacterium]